MLKISRRYPKKRAFITGAASGLGKALAKILIEDGWQVGIADIGSERLAETAKQFGKQATAYWLDVANDVEYAKVANDFIKKFGGIDLLVNNAGVGDGSAFEQYSTENWRWIIGINQLGVIYGCKFFIPAMIQQKGGQIINVSSAAAFSNLPRMAPYNVTKAAVLSLSETLYAEYKTQGIAVSVVMPTFFRTNIDRFARGGIENQQMAHKLLATSGIEANEIAQQILTQAANNTFYIVLPGKSKIIFWLKRMFPNIVLSITALAASKRAFFENKLNERYNKLAPDARQIE